MKKLLILFLFYPLFLFADAKVLENEIQFTATHQFKKINGKVDTLKISPIQIKKNAGSYSVSPFNIQIQLKDMKTGDANRDNHMMEALGYPDENEITLDIIKVEPIEKKYKISFKIKINGITKEMISNADVTEADGKLKVSGTFTIQLDQFDITPPSLFFVKVKNDVICDYKFNLQGE